MNKLNRLVKKIIKAISGYKIERRGQDRSSFIALARDNIEMQSFYLDSLLLFDKTQNETIATKGIYDYLLQLRLKTILKKYQIDLVLDVGANTGQFASSLRNIGYKQKIISFEPVSTTFSRLQETASIDPNWDVYNLALGRENGEQKINVADSSAFTSFLTANSWCEQKFGKISVGSREETVRVRRLDEFLTETVENLDRARIYLKMDTQGYDLEVFAGVDRLYPRIFALQSEVSVIPIYQNMPHLTDSITHFEKTGFELAGMYPVTLDQSTLRVVEFDCLMVNSRVQQ
jgi:FkbM family methyltransferase